MRLPGIAGVILPHGGPESAGGTETSMSCKVAATHGARGGSDDYVGLAGLRAPHRVCCRDRSEHGVLVPALLAARASGAAADNRWRNAPGREHGDVRPDAERR